MLPHAYSYAASGWHGVEKHLSPSFLQHYGNCSIVSIGSPRPDSLADVPLVLCGVLVTLSSYHLFKVTVGIPLGALRAEPFDPCRRRGSEVLASEGSWGCFGMWSICMTSACQCLSLHRYYSYENSYPALFYCPIHNLAVQPKNNRVNVLSIIVLQPLGSISFSAK